MTPAWERLEPPWRECFLLAWESFRAGSIPVGAVLLDGAGTTVSRGRNRRSERSCPAGQISASGLAHGFVDVGPFVDAAGNGGIDMMLDIALPGRSG